MKKKTDQEIVNECIKEVNEVLEKHSCRAEGVTVITGDKVSTVVRIIKNAKS